MSQQPKQLKHLSNGLAAEKIKDLKSMFPFFPPDDNIFYENLIKKSCESNNKNKN